MNMPSGPGPLSRLWYRWKSLKLPWRRQVLCGSDLSGNTFWEFKDAINQNRVRRIVKYTSSVHHSDVKVSPQWHQWLRHTKLEPPSMQEQQLEVTRQTQIKRLAAEADARWASQPSFLDGPVKQQPEPAIGVNDPGGHVQQTEPTEKEGVRSATGDPTEVEAAALGGSKDSGRFREKKPYSKPSQGSPGEGWQPQSWTPGGDAKR